MKYIKIKKLKPQFSTVLTTLDVFEDDLFIDGVLVAPKGSLKTYQTVIDVGSFVKNVQPGDKVLINFENYKVRKYKENSLKEDLSAMEDEIVYDIPKLVVDGKLIGKFQDRDIEGVITDFEEVEVESQEESLI